jgi:hypothetical protein
MDTKEIQIKDYNYPLPDERIAKFPLPERDSSKLLVYRSGEVTDDVFRSLPNYLPQGALMVFNNTKVIRARLHFRKKTLSGSPYRWREEYGDDSQLSTLNSQLVNGALIEIFLLEPASPVEYQENFIATSECSWYCLVGNSKKWKEGLLQEAVITSKIGGTLRLRSYLPLEGEGLQEAVGDCPNPLMAPADIKQPLQSKELKDLQLLAVPAIYEYDVETKPGQTIRVKIEPHN